MRAGSNRDTRRARGRAAGLGGPAAGDDHELAGHRVASARTAGSAVAIAVALPGCDRCARSCPVCPLRPAALARMRHCAIESRYSRCTRISRALVEAPVGERHRSSHERRAARLVIRRPFQARLDPLRDDVDQARRAEHVGQADRRCRARRTSDTLPISRARRRSGRCLPSRSFLRCPQTAATTRPPGSEAPSDHPDEPGRSGRSG